MFLIPETVPPYLIGRGTLDPADIVDGHLAIREAGRRNRNYAIRLGDGSGVFLKQNAKIDPYDQLTMQMEANILRLSRDDARMAPVRETLPRIRDYDPLRHTLTVDWVANSTPMTQILVAPPQAGASTPYTNIPASFRPDLSRSLGMTLGQFHAASAALMDDPEVLAVFPRNLPFCLNIPSMVSSGYFPPTAPRDVWQLMAATPILQHWSQPAALAWKPQCIINGDVKWDNVLLSGTEADALPHITLIDWECGDIGDPAMDMAYLLSSYIQCFFIELSLRQAPVPPGGLWSLVDPEVKSALQQAVLALIEGYRETTLASGQTNAFLDKVILFLGFRFLQGAAEHCQSQPSMTPAAILSVQTGASCLEDPKGMLTHLLGETGVTALMQTQGAAA